AVFYLRIEVPDLVPRVLTTGGFDYWESGMDIPMGNDLYESFTNYQVKVIEQLDHLARDYEFDVVDAMHGFEVVHEYVWRKVAELVGSERAVSVAPDITARS